MSYSSTGLIIGGYVKMLCETNWSLHSDPVKWMSPTGLSYFVFSNIWRLLLVFSYGSWLGEWIICFKKWHFRMLSGRCNLADGINADMWYPLPNLQLSEEVRRIISVYFLTNLVSFVSRSFQGLRYYTLNISAWRILRLSHLADDCEAFRQVGERQYNWK
jgi:hypothetical protein